MEMAYKLSFFNCIFHVQFMGELCFTTYRRSGLVNSREQGLRFIDGFVVPVLMS